MLKKTKNILMILFGATVMGIALDVFLVPSQIAAGGVGGISTIIYYLTGLPVGILILLINIPIFILGALNFNMKFLYASILGTVAMSLSAEFFTFLKPITNDIILCSVFGGAIYGFGLSCVLRAGGTTGGTDIVSLVFKKFFPNFSIGQFIIAIDGVVIALAGIAFRRWDTILYSSATLLVSSRVLDLIMEGVDYAKIAYIVSDKSKDISREIYSRVSRGVTGLNAVSMYNGSDKRVLMCVIRKYELHRLKEVVQKTDPNAFLVITDAKEVVGYGFKEIK